MKSTKYFLLMAATLLCGATRVFGGITLTEKDGLLTTISTNDAGTSQYEYTSPVLTLEEPSNVLYFTFLKGKSTSGDDGMDTSGYPFVAFAEFCLYDGEGNEIALDASNFSTNAQETGEGPINDICDDDRSTFWHSTWSSGVNDYHYLQITLPEGQMLSNFQFKYFTRWTRHCLPSIIYVDSIPAQEPFLLSGTCGDNLTWSLMDGELVIEGTGDMVADSSFMCLGRVKEITISEGVTSIGDRAFQKFMSLVSVFIPEGVTSIGDYAFYCCDSLTSITIPESVTSIGSSAFEGCSSLESITIPEGVTSIGSSAFDGCSSLASINIPESVTSIGDYAFYSCNNLTSITIPEGVTSIGDYAFSGCSGLTSITIPESVTSIGNSAFSGCSGLTSITIPENVTSIGYNVFGSCSSLTSITVDEGNTVYDSRNGCNAIIRTANNELIAGCSATVIPEGVTSIGSSAFDGCSSLASINIPESVTSIGNYAFYSCNNLTSITIPEGVTSIGGSAFFGCNKLFTVINNSNLSISKGSSSYGYVAYYAERVLNGNDLVTIGNFQFYTSNDDHYLANYIGDGCTLVLPNDYNGENYNVDDYAFYGYDNIRSLTIGSGVLSIGDNAFSTNPKKTIWLTNTPPTNYTNAKGSINYVANDQYTNLSNVKMYSYLSSMFEVDGVKYVPVSPSDCTCHAIDCVYDSAVTVINVGETALSKGVAMKVVEVMPYTFYGNNHIKQASISHIGNIGSQAFYGCNSLETAIVANLAPLSSSNSNVPLTFADWTSTNKTDGSTNSETYTFTVDDGAVLSFDWWVSSERGYDKLIVTLDDTTILEESGSLSDTYSNEVSQGEHTLIVKYTKDGSQSSGSDQAKVSNIVVSKVSNVIAGVGSEAFSGCSSLKVVTLGDSIGSLGNKAFYQCSSLREIVIPNSVKAIGIYCFRGCSAMKSAIIGNGVESIGGYTFSGCSSLEDFSFGSGMETIGANAFSDCTNLTLITSHATVPPICDTQALDGINKGNCTLRVPQDYADAYCAADQWKEFFLIEDVVEVEQYVLTYVVDGEVYHTEVLKHKDVVTMLAEPVKVACEFSGWDKTLAAMPAEDVVISGTFTRLPIEHLTIIDMETEFALEEDLELETVTYIRSFTSTNWNALYVPFEIPVTEDLLTDFEVADINNVHQYDHNDDGVTDETIIEAFKVTSGTLEANYPYLIRAKEVGEKSIIVTDATLYATKENSIDCSSVREKFTFTGTYNRMTSNELTPNEGYYTLIDGEWQPMTEETTLGAFRFYLKVDSRNGNAMMARTIRMRIVGENGSSADDDTGIEMATANGGQPKVVYDLQGRRVEKATKGIYIVGGKKVVIK